MSIHIEEITISDIYNASNFEKLVKEYSENTQLQYTDFARSYYLQQEKEKKLQAFGVYDDKELIGFATMLFTFYPHLNKNIGTIESIFITKAKRKTLAGSKLIFKLRQFARKQELIGLFLGLPYTSKLNEKYKKIFHPMNILYFAKV